MEAMGLLNINLSIKMSMFNTMVL